MFEHVCPVLIQQLRQRGILSALDEHFAYALHRISGETDPDVLLAAALLSRNVRLGHICIDLQRLSSEALFDESGKPADDLPLPDAGRWTERLSRSAVLGGDEAPLVFDSRGRLYLRRYWEHERRLVKALRARVEAVDFSVDAKLLREGLDRFFPEPPPNGDLDWQRVAAAVALRRQFCVISGGPGTGKTFTVVKILALLIEQAQARGKRLRVALLAPTGKAAARLRESVERARGGLRCSDKVKDAIPTDAMTIHRCLGSFGAEQVEFRHNAGNPLRVDVVLVDEASMVDLALMSRLVDALPAHARLILLGDKDQLASVEAGAILGDICNAGQPGPYSRPAVEQIRADTGIDLRVAPDAPQHSGIWDCIVQLNYSYRYPPDSGIGRLARAVNRGDAAEALDVVKNSSGEVKLIDPDPSGLADSALQGRARAWFEKLCGSPPAESLRALGEFRILCAHRRGPYGVEVVNAQIENSLAAAGKLRTGSLLYAGRPLLINRNDYSLELYNGDTGVILCCEDRFTAYFDSGGSKPRHIAPSRLPPHESVFAMSIHKSQGSEFDEVAVLLPTKESPLLSRELLYTAITRAKRVMRLHATRDVLSRAIARRIERVSGLRDTLWGT